MTEPNEASSAAAILLLDDDVIARSAVASYLRECGYVVIEAASETDAMKMLGTGKYGIDIVVCAAKDAKLSDAFSFVAKVRAEHPDVRVLIAATVEKTARLASELCQEGPHLRKPYDHQELLNWIKRLRK